MQGAGWWWGIRSKGGGRGGDETRPVSSFCSTEPNREMKATNARCARIGAREYLYRGEDSARLASIRASRRLAPPRVGQRVARASGVKHALRRHATSVRLVEVRVASPRTDRRAPTRAPPREPNRTNQTLWAHPDVPPPPVERPAPAPRITDAPRPPPRAFPPQFQDRDATRAMGMPAGGFDTSKVWSPAGGWFPDPKAWKRNTLMGLAFVGVAGAFIFDYSRKVEQRPLAPTRRIPSQAWCTNFPEGSPAK